MATAARWDMASWRNEARAFTIIVRGRDLTGVALRQQVREAPDTPGDPIIALETVATGTQGLRLESVTIEDGVPVSRIVGRYDLATMRDKLPYGAEAGQDYRLSHAVQIGGVTRLYGDWWALATPMDSNNADTAGEPVYDRGSGAPAVLSGASVTIAGDEVIEITLDGTAEVSLLAAQATDAATQAKSAATAAQTSADGIKTVANDATGARALLERIYGLPIALPNNGNPNSLSFPATSRAAPANKERFEVIIIAPNTASVNLNAAGVTRRLAKPGTGANLDVGQLAAPRIVTLERSDEGGNIFALISQRALVIPGTPTAADLAAVIATASGTGTAFESLLGVPVALPSPDANNIKVTGLAPADGEVIEAYITSPNTGASNLEKGGVKRRIIANPGTGAELVGGELKAGTIRKFTYSAGGFSYILGAARTPTFNATPPVPPPVGSRKAALLQQPWGKVEFPNGGHAVVTPTTHPVLFIGSSNAATGYAPANAMPSDVAVSALNEFFPGDGSQFVADLQATHGGPWSDAGRQLGLSQAFVDGKVVWVLSLFGMNECRTIFYADYGGLLAQIGAARDAVAYIRSKGAEAVLNTIFDPDPRDPSKLEPDYFASNPIRSMAYPAYKAAPVDPNLDMMPAGNAMLTEPRDWTGSGILTTGYKRIWQFNRMIRALAAELGCPLLDFAFSCRRNCFEKVPDLSDALDRYFRRGDGLHPLEAFYVEGVNPVYRQWARAMADGRDDIRVFRGL